ncbi:MAG TPA: hypothetical protein VHG69_13450 [Thermoleophilaceae bacterium]|nr:hypothetical protein [Thermoleophilaceae bacterium]
MLRLWRGRRRRSFRLLLLLAVLLLVALTVFAIISWASAGAGPFRVDGGCSNNQFGCGTLIEIAATVLAVGFASGVFVFWRVSRVVRAHLRDWRERPYRLVPTATPIEHVVGRDGICEIIEEDLANPRPRPQIVVGGVGEGKTAVLVRLAERLVERGAIPVAVRLRDAKAGLDFETLAREAFTSRVQEALISEDEGDKVWRKLRRDRVIVVLADGLEEAMIGAQASEIRSALEQAEDDRLPLVVTARPDELLVGVNAAVIRLEPLSARATINYIARQGDRDLWPEEQVDRIRTLADVAEIADRPLFLALMRESYRRKADGRPGLDAIPPTSRLDVQVKLLQQWRERLVRDAGRAPELRKKREEMLVATERMACVALAENTLELDFERFRRSPYGEGAADHRVNPRDVAREAERLQLVDMTEGGMRFKHSILQAYLGAEHLPELVGRSRDRLRSRLLGRFPAATHVTGPDYLADALDEPGREVLMALEICANLHGSKAIRSTLRERLRSAATGRGLADQPIAFDVLAAAWEIDAMLGGKGSRGLANTAVKLWGNADRPPTRELRERKVRAILGMARARTPHAYGALWDICILERDYRVRFRAAQELARGGDQALLATEPEEVFADCAPRLTYRGEPIGLRALDVRKGSVQGWVLPLLALNCETTAPRALENLTGWTDLTRGRNEDGAQLHLGVEACFAQGFRLAANRIPPDDDDSRTRGRLIELATELLEEASWWHSRIALVQAVALWALSAKDGQREKLEHKIEQRAREDGHPFVRAAAALCRDAVSADGNARRLPRGERRAARQGHCGPARYIWIDEVGVSAKVGPRRTFHSPNSPDGLWISRDAGWRSLAPRARQLVADELVLLNLVEGEAPPAGIADAFRRNGRRLSQEANESVDRRERRRQRVAGNRLPHCLAHADGRRRLAVIPSTDNAAERSAADGCRDACNHGLCPYPELGVAPFRDELSETFCREQARLLTGHWKDFPAGRWERQGYLWRFLRRARALPDWVSAGPRLRPWRQRSARRELGAFWRQMEERAKR